MPELPEVETICVGLEKWIVGARIATVSYDTEKSFPNAPQDTEQFLLGATIAAVRRRAKVLLVELSSGYTLMIHLKMTGQLVYIGAAAPSQTTQPRFGAGHPNDSLVGELPDKSTRVIFEFDDGGHLYFNDQRKFGWIKLYPSSALADNPLLSAFGPEPLDKDTTAQMLFDRLQRRKNTTIKAALLDQTVVAGIGNIYADESLWGACIHPSTRVRDLDTKHVQKLFSEIQQVLALSIEKGGSTDKNYVNVEGKRGSYIDFARVFRREGLACPRCGTLIQKLRVAGRGTHVCPLCQRAP